MDETSLVTLAALLVIFAALGWVLGIVGFFRAGRALAGLAPRRQPLPQPIQDTAAAVQPTPLPPPPGDPGAPGHEPTQPPSPRPSPRAKRHRPSRHHSNQSPPSPSRSH